MRAIPIGERGGAAARRSSRSRAGAIRKVRQSVSRLTKAGYRFRVVAAEDADATCARSSTRSRSCGAATEPERGFSMAMDDLYAPGTMFAVARGRGRRGRRLPPSRAVAGGRRLVARDDAAPARHAERPHRVPHRRDARLGEGARARRELSLNFCALTDLISPERAVTLPRRLLRRALLAADSVFQLERLHSFSRKFHPEWRPRYLCVEKLSDLPLVGLAYLHVEQLLVAARGRGSASASACHTESMAQPATRSLGRLSEIAQVMVRHGFGYFLEAHKLTDLLPGRSRRRGSRRRRARRRRAASTCASCSTSSGRRS